MLGYFSCFGSADASESVVVITTIQSWNAKSNVCFAGGYHFCRLLNRVRLTGVCIRLVGSAQFLYLLAFFCCPNLFLLVMVARRGHMLLGDSLTSSYVLMDIQSANLIMSLCDVAGVLCDM